MFMSENGIAAKLSFCSAPIFLQYKLSGKYESSCLCNGIDRIELMFPLTTRAVQKQLALVQRLLQHSSAAVTQRYIGIEAQRIEKAIEGHAKGIIT